MRHRLLLPLAPTALLLALLGALLLGAPSEGGAQDRVDAGSAILLPGDMVEVQVWREEDLGGEFLVDEDGILTLPLLGRISVTGIPARELRRQLLEGYAAELRNPSIQIVFLRRIHVLGEVREPGLVQADLSLSLAGAVALAGGASPQGDLRKLTILRDGEVVVAEVGPELNLTAIGIRSGDQILVGRRSWFDRNSGFLASGLLGFLGVVIATLL